MIKLDEKIPGHGTVDTRGAVASKVLRQLKEQAGTFEHNGVEIVVHPDSTARELEHQFRLKRK